MGDCAHCKGCSECGGCGNQLLLTEPEIKLLRLFGQIPFLPVARKADNMDPVFLELGAPDFYRGVIENLERKGLIDLDYHQDLKGFPYKGYEGYPLKGSMSLTGRGQEVLDLLDLQGCSE
jgi:hypothetical protein